MVMLHVVVFAAEQKEGVTEEVEKKALKVVWIAGGNPGSTWNQAVRAGQSEAEPIIEDMYPNIDVQFKYQYFVGPADVAFVVESFIEEGYDIIVSDSFYQEQLKEIIEENQHVMFSQAGFTTSKTPNATVWDWGGRLGYYLVGIVAGGMTKTNKIGFITAFKSPLDAKAYNSYIAGALRVNPDVKGFYSFTGSYVDVAKGRSAASAMIAKGVNFVVGYGDGMTRGVIKEAEANGVYSAGCYWDQHEVAPDTVVTSYLYKSTPLIKDIVIARIENNVHGQLFSYELEDNIAGLAPFHNFESVVPQYVKDNIAEVWKLARQGKSPIANNPEWPE